MNEIAEEIVIKGPGDDLPSVIRRVDVLLWYIAVIVTLACTVQILDAAGVL